ncbi:MAG: T9SS type A sorting domain-containing protein [Cyclobacteriaceae bacterium]
MRFISYIALLFLLQVSIAQLKVKPIQNSSEKTIKQARTTTVKPAGLPFWDDFSISNTAADSLRVWGSDTSLQWESALSANVFINSTLAINPPSYKVATFDGLDQNGNFYSNDNSATGLADELVSTSIDLSGKTVGDNIYFSFFWQAGGNVEKPEEGDSLVLHFMNSDSSWIPIWQAEGSEGLDETIFTQQIIEVTTAFLSKNFRFRFQSYGDLDGPFDAWHVDWIYLNEGRSNVDNGYLDRAFSGDLTSPLAPFNAVPVNQFNTDNRFVTNQKIEVSNLDATDLYPIDVAYSLTNTIDNTVLIADTDRAYSVLLQSEKDTITLLDSDLIPINLTDVDFSSITVFDSVVLQTKISLKSNDAVLDGSFVDLRVNDTIQQNYTLHNYYAFDDGTAEFAAGTNIRNGQVAVKFWVEQQDTITHVDFNFPNISPILQTAPTLTLKILRSLSPEISATSEQITVENNASRNSFTRYELSRPVVVSDTFYVAYQQFLNDFIGIGFDRSNSEASQYIFENKDGDWIQNISLNGALMIRPVFREGVDFILGKELEQELSVYPNPTRGTFAIKEAYEKVELLDLSGKVLFVEKKQASHDISKFREGVYLLKIHLKEVQKIQKIILK